MSAVLDRAPTIEDVRAFYDDYVEALDDVRLDEWPDFFSTECTYQVIPRENHERGFSLCTMMAESRGMLRDRVTGLTRTQMYAPRTYRRFLSGVRIKAQGADGTRTRMNVLIVQTLVDKQSEVVLTGVSHDLLVHDEGRLRLKERIVVMDSEMVPNSLIYPA